MIPTAQNVCGPLCGYTIEELRIQSMWAPDKAQVGSGYGSGDGRGCTHNDSHFHVPTDTVMMHPWALWLFICYGRREASDS